MLAFLMTLYCKSGAVETTGAAESIMTPVPLKSTIRQVQPMTGIVFWDDSENNKSESIQLEFSYLRYSDIVTTRNTYDWSVVEKKLDEIAGRKHQAILRFYFIYPGRPTAVPSYIKSLPDYKETKGKSEKQDTGFSDWSHPELKRFVKEFYTRFAERYDKDRRLAFVQTGFGLWAEYHIYDGPFKLGGTFPDKAFQAEFLNHLASTFKVLPWSISVDAADEDVTPLAGNADLLKLPFGVFDDSFLCKQHAKENEVNWNALGRDRYLRAPAGGEFSYYSDHDQKMALAANGPHGISFEKAAKDFHVTYMIGNDEPEHQSMKRIHEAGMACGYKFRVDMFQTSERSANVRVSNTGIAPIYRDAFVAVNGVRAAESLKGLRPGTASTFLIASGGASPVITIECDYLVPGQVIEFDADLK